MPQSLASALQELVSTSRNETNNRIFYKKSISSYNGPEKARTPKRKFSKTTIVVSLN